MDMISQVTISNLGISIFLMTQLFISCVGSSDKSDHSLIVGDYEFSRSRNLGGQTISGVWRLKLTKEKDAYMYTIQKTILTRCIAVYLSPRPLGEN